MRDRQRVWRGGEREGGRVGEKEGEPLNSKSESVSQSLTIIVRAIYSIRYMYEAGWRDL